MSSPFLKCRQLPKKSYMKSSRVLTGEPPPMSGRENIGKAMRQQTEIDCSKWEIHSTSGPHKIQELALLVSKVVYF